MQDLPGPQLQDLLMFLSSLVSANGDGGSGALRGWARGKVMTILGGKQPMHGDVNGKRRSCRATHARDLCNCFIGGRPRQWAMEKDYFNLLPGGCGPSSWAHTNLPIGGRTMGNGANGESHGSWKYIE